MIDRRKIHKRNLNRSILPVVILKVFVIFLFSQLFFPKLTIISPSKIQASEMSTTTDNYPYSQVSQNGFGEGASAYWIYYPKNATAQSLPVVLFLHGWLAIDPYYYGGWIDHLVKQGNIVIYPAYQNSREESADEMLANAIRATQNAISHLKNNSQIKANLNNFAIVGHSLGGGLSVQIASRANQANLPTPKAIMAVQPGWRGEASMPIDTLKQIDPSVKLWIVEGDADQFSGSRQGKTIYNATSQIPPQQKNFVILSSNNKNLVVDHNAPVSPLESYRGRKLTRQEKRQKRFRGWLLRVATGLQKSEISNLDKKGFWPLFDGLTQTAFNRKSPVTNTFETKANNFSSLSSGQGTPQNPRQVVIE